MVKPVICIVDTGSCNIQVVDSVKAGNAWGCVASGNVCSLFADEYLSTIFLLPLCMNESK